MRIKVGDAWISSEDQPIAVELNDGEREQIAEMEAGVRVYCQFPDTMAAESVKIWMADGARAAAVKTEVS